MERGLLLWLPLDWGVWIVDCGLEWIGKLAVVGYLGVEDGVVAID